MALRSARAAKPSPNQIDDLPGARKRGIRLLVGMMDVEETDVLDCFAEVGSELKYKRVVSEGDAFAFSGIAGYAGAEVAAENFSGVDAAGILVALRVVANNMDEAEVTAGGGTLSSRRS